MPIRTHYAERPPRAASALNVTGKTFVFWKDRKSPPLTSCCLCTGGGLRPFTFAVCATGPGMVNLPSTMRVATREISCQTEETHPIRSTLDSTRQQARTHGQFITDARCLRATVKSELKTHLRMPSTQSATMHVTVAFHAIPLMAWKMLFPKGSFEWHSERTQLKSTHVGLIMCPFKLNNILDLGTVITYGKGSTKLMVGADGKGAARSMLGYAPPFKVWHQACADDTMQSMLSCYMVILDESGELRTPPDHAYTDAEELAIKSVMMENLKKYSDWEFPLSDMFLEHLDDWEQALAEDLEREEENGTESVEDLSLESSS